MMCVKVVKCLPVSERLQKLYEDLKSFMLLLWFDPLIVSHITFKGHIHHRAIL
jgi:hypothetical protein